ncbi:MAG: toll/interleukin-1 receptor domain-containing protein [Cyanothece sp. SIO2G6]|nr:toll/interleukin-1 receptor domain-containing protein [Cyanothece sp. SIO2G6]
MNPLQDVFISYGRADSTHFAKMLNDRLVELGYTVWFDGDDIPFGVDYQKQIDDGIEKADNFIFVIAPHSTNSKYCGLEIDLALKHNKRIFPLLHVETGVLTKWKKTKDSSV